MFLRVLGGRQRRSTGFFSTQRSSFLQDINTAERYKNKKTPLWIKVLKSWQRVRLRAKWERERSEERSSLERSIRRETLLTVVSHIEWIKSAHALFEDQPDSLLNYSSPKLNTSTILGVRMVSVWRTHFNSLHTLGHATRPTSLTLSYYTIWKC